MQRHAQLNLPALIITNAVLKLLWLGNNELAHDEPFTVYWSQRPLNELWEMLRTENNPPLYFLLIKAWSSFTPFEAAWLRVPSAIFSALAVWPLFLLGRALGGMRVALVASLLFTFCNYHYGYAHEVRGYSLFTLLAITIMWQLWRVSQRERSASRWLAIAGAAMVYTHFFGWLLLGVALLCTLLVKDLRPARRTFLISLAIIAVLYLPYAAIFLGRLGTSVEQGTWLTAPEPEELYNMIWRWSNAPVISVLFLLLIIVATARTRAQGSAFNIGLIWTFVPLIGMFLASYLAPMFLDRYLVYAAPGFALLVPAAVERIGLLERVNAIVAAAAVAGMAITFKPWQDSGLHPSRVVLEVRKACEAECTIEVIPGWYWPTYLSASDISALRNDLGPYLGGRPEKASHRTAEHPSSPSDTTANHIVVNAGSDLVDPGRAWYTRLQAMYPMVDSVEADRKVWVYHFHRLTR